MEATGNFELREAVKKAAESYGEFTKAIEELRDIVGKLKFFKNELVSKNLTIGKLVKIDPEYRRLFFGGLKEDKTEGWLVFSKNALGLWTQNIIGFSLGSTPKRDNVGYYFKNLSEILYETLPIRFRNEYSGEVIKGYAEFLSELLASQEKAYNYENAKETIGLVEKFISLVSELLPFSNIISTVGVLLNGVPTELIDNLGIDKNLLLNAGFEILDFGPSIKIARFKHSELVYRISEFTQFREVIIPQALKNLRENLKDFPNEVIQYITDPRYRLNVAYEWDELKKAYIKRYTWVDYYDEGRTVVSDEYYEVSRLALLGLIEASPWITEEQGKKRVRGVWIYPAPYLRRKAYYKGRYYWEFVEDVVNIAREFTK